MYRPDIPTELTDNEVYISYLLRLEDTIASLEQQLEERDEQLLSLTESLQHQDEQISNILLELKEERMQNQLYQQQMCSRIKTLDFHLNALRETTDKKIEEKNNAIRSLSQKLRFAELSIRKKASQMNLMKKNKVDKRDDMTIVDLQDPNEDASEDAIGTKESSVPTITESFLNELIYNASCAPTHRVYSPSFIDFGFSLYIISPSCYETLRSVLHFPHRTTLMRHKEPEMAQMKNMLTDISNLGDLLEVYKKRYEIEESRALIAVDACYSTTFCETDSRAFFVYLLVPLSGDKPVLPLHYIKKDTGNADKNTIDALRQITACCKKNGIQVSYISTDGDTSYNESYKDSYNLQEFDHETSIKSNLGYFGSRAEPIFIPDILHLLKNLRTFLIADDICIYIVRQTREGIDTFDFSILTSVLGAEDYLIDRSNIGKMRDCYPLQLFTFENALRLYLHGARAHSAIVLTFAFLTATLFGDQFTLGLRCDFIEFVISALATLTSKQQEVQGLLYPERLRRLYLLLYALLKELKTETPSFSFNRLGTHTLENFFGTVRQVCSYDHRPERMERVIVSRSLVGLTHLPGKKKRRHRSDGGMALNEATSTFGTPLPVSSDAFKSIIATLMRSESNSAVTQLFTWVESTLTDNAKKRVRTPSQVSNQTIMTRNLQKKQKNKL